MKVYVFVLNILFFLGINSSAKFSNPSCPSKSDEKIWENNKNACMRAFRLAIEKKQVDEKISIAFCECGADEFVTKMSCEELEKFNSDPSFQKEYSARTSKICQGKYPIKKLK